MANPNAGRIPRRPPKWTDYGFETIVNEKLFSGYGGRSSEFLMASSFEFRGAPKKKTLVNEKPKTFSRKSTKRRQKSNLILICNRIVKREKVNIIYSIDITQPTPQNEQRQVLHMPSYSHLQPHTELSLLQEGPMSIQALNLFHLFTKEFM
ncbi:hypothetical protein ACSQ67_020459 [Phaseolus vulgaris]